MTFFANAGVKWPSAEIELQQAGTQALSGGADFWRLVSTIEAWETHDSARRDVREAQAMQKSCARTLAGAANKYYGLLVVDSPAFEFERPIDPPTPEELEQAATIFPIGFPSRPYRERGEFTISSLYGELADRLDALAVHVRGLDLAQDQRELAFEIFKAMRQWELIAWLARLIAVLNRRTRSG
jgi:hypothetical protein